MAQVCVQISVLKSATIVSMANISQIGRQGQELLVAQLKAAGRTVEVSPRKTFDLVVDGRFAEVKSTSKSYERFDETFLTLTQKQYDAMAKDKIDFTIFLVCNVDGPGGIDVKEFPASKLREREPVVEATYYYRKRDIDAVLGGD